MGKSEIEGNLKGESNQAEITSCPKLPFRIYCVGNPAEVT